MKDDFELAIDGDHNAQVRVALLTVSSHLCLLMSLPPELLTPQLRRSARELASASVALLKDRP